MKKNYYSIKHSKWVYILPISFLLISTILYGCFKLKSIDHPETALTEDSFDVAFVCEPDVGLKTEARGYLGVLLPEGWEPQGTTDFTVLFPEGTDDIHGQLTYDKDYTDKLKAKNVTPVGYYWWGGRSKDDLELIKKVGDAEIKCINFSFTFRIFTDKKTGDFNLRYVIGTDGDSKDPSGEGQYVDVSKKITITENPNPPVNADVVDIQQPATQQTYSETEVDFSYIPFKADNGNNRLFFGALLPKGWRVQDYTDCVIEDDGGTKIGSGRFSYDQYYSDILESKYAAPEGYYWWGGRTIDQISLKPTNNLSFKFKIYNDAQVGEFKLRYVITGGTDKSMTDYFKDETYYPISVSAGNQFPIKKDLNWELIANNGWDENVKYYSDKDYDGFFTRWYGWNGGDIGISSLLNDGRSIWVWGDSHSGMVLSDRTRITDQTQFERNYIIQQDGEDFSAFKLINEGTPGNIKEALIPTDDDGKPTGKHEEWYWPDGSAVYYRDGVPELQMVLSRMENNGEGGMWGMRGVGVDVAVFTLPDLKLKEIVKNRHKTVHVEGGSLGYAGQVFKDDDGTVYVYSSAGLPGICATNTVIARVKNGDLTAQWEFYNAATKLWSTDTSWQNNVDNWEKAGFENLPMFVFKDGGKYYAFGLPPCFGREIYIYDAATPYGPFTNKRLVAKLPDEITEGYVTTLPGVHQQLSKHGELMFSVSKNYDNEARKEQGLPQLEWYNVPGCADEYRPYFFRVKNWRDKLNISSLDATDNKGILTAQYEEGMSKATDNDEKTVYTTTSGSAWIQYESLTPVNLRRYTITSAPDAPEKDPLHWKVLGSNDGQTWTILDERYYSEFEERSQTISYVVPIDTEYTHFRLDVLASKGGAGLQLAEWQLFGKFEYEKETTAELEHVIVNEKPVSQLDDVILIDVLSTDPVEHIIDFKAKNYGNLDNSEKLFTVIEEAPGINTYRLNVKLDKPGVYVYNLKVTSENEENEKEYKVIISRRFAFDEAIKVKWNNTLMLYLNRLEDYDITGYQWHKNDSPISGATGKTYSAGPKKGDALDLNAAYHVSMTTPDGVMRSEAKNMTLKAMGVQVYPNPAKPGQALTVEANIDEELLSGASIEVYNSQGNKVNTTKVVNPSTSVYIPSTTGTYFLQFKGNSGFEQTLKVVVK